MRQREAWMVIPPQMRRELRAYGSTVEGGRLVTLEEKIVSYQQSIDWAEDELALARSWKSRHGIAFARPDDWIDLLDDLEDGKAVLLAIRDERNTQTKGTQWST